MKVAAAVLITLSTAQSLIEGFSHIAGYLTGREPEDTFVNQVSQAGSDAVLGTADNLRGGVHSRAMLNSSLLRKNLELVNKGGNAIKDIASQTYIGAGLIGASDSIKSNFIHPALPNLNFPSVLRGDGPMRSLISTVFQGFDN